MLPSATEIVCALGAGADLVGRSAECDYPPAVRALPVVMRPRTLDAARPSDEIDRRVRTARAAGESLYDLELDQLRRLRPDVLLTQDLCGVCSVTEAEVTAACAAAGIAPTVVSLTPRTLADVWASVETVGRAIGRTERARRLARSLAARAGERATGPPARVAVVEWLDPPILAGLWTPRMVRAAGATPVGPEEGAPGERVTWPQIAARRPELIVLSPCSFDLARTGRELAAPALAARVARAAARSRIVLADEAYFSRPGPRLADGIELLRALRVGRTEGPFPMPVRPYAAPAEEVSA